MADKIGTYGQKTSFEDAKVTVTEFLDDFYDDSEGNYNQAFLNLERRLQEYFEYEPRDTEDNGQNRPTTRRVYVVYNDGLEMKRTTDAAEADALVKSYDGNHEVWVEEEEEPV